jgi:hypothetical protein
MIFDNSGAEPFLIVEEKQRELSVKDNDLFAAILTKATPKSSQTLKAPPD